MISYFFHIRCKQFLLLGIFVVITTSTFAQSISGKGYQHELRATTVNDSYFGLKQDHYYTNGLQIGYGRLLGNEFSLLGLLPKKERKSIFSLKIAHQIYTPRFIKETKPGMLDRPYAGYFYLKATANSFWDKQKNLKAALTLGVIGPASGAEQIQTSWHRWFNLDRPRGWRFQISNEPVVNLNLLYRRSWFFSSNFDVTAGTGFSVGTAFNDISAGATVRFGDINSIDHSAMYNSQLGKTRNINYKNEWFVFLGWKNKLVFHNTLIDGGVVSSSESTLNRQSKPYLSKIEWGSAYSISRITWKLVMSRLSPEVTSGEKHILVSFDMALRF